MTPNMRPTLRWSFQPDDRQGAPVVIVLTQYAYAAAYRERCFDAGADHFFDKANEFDDVFAVLSALGER